MDHSKKIYSETFGDGPFGFKVYHYDYSGNVVQIILRSDRTFESKEDAQDAAVEYCEANDINVDLTDKETRRVDLEDSLLC